MSARRWAPWVALVLAVVVIGLLARSEGSDEPFDPRGTGDSGTRGLVLLLEEMGADVRIAPRPEAVTRGTAVLFVDEIGRKQRDAIQRWVEDGGVLVVTDPESDFVPAIAAGGVDPFAADDGEGAALRNDCDLPSLEDVDVLHVPSAARYRAAPDSTACFRSGATGSGYVVARGEGEGVVVAIGGGAPFVNEYLADADNSVLAVGLLAPQPGTEVTVVVPDVAGSGDDSLLDLVPDGAWRGIWQLAAAFVVLVVAAGRRVARPVVETRPVEIPGSELVVAVGNLLQHAGRREAAAGMLRLQLRRELAERFGVPADAPAEQVAAVLDGHGIPAARVAALLSPSSVPDDKALARYAADVENLRREVMHV